ncbi:related to Coatomer subunit zeta [Saccharomycodes ludwigii]|uniref:Coatomer subunit zeta n=1 Tax=Saccharomycodes ludwigii TaxID=36035 RepID=A0A376B3C1_9ASCO|nr:hypothetical protein SCDLUD_000707 [Saccharomycodes ludwigii]KAH3903095.1 hypothetical protein SCDLUD_000707 [Saccharomycodes ludwigii]SSD59188.1 related to Coatomer subunit zeta [Saccharomycodes ludwigii]
MTTPTLYTVSSYLILDSKGNRIYTKYFNPPFSNKDSIITKKNNTNGEDEEEYNTGLQTNLKKQITFEKNLFKKTHKTDSDIIIFEDKIIIYKEYADVSLYLVSSDLEVNECLLQLTFDGIKDALELILDNGLDKNNIQEHFDMCCLAIDESIDDGIVLEYDGATIASRVTSPPTKDSAHINIDLSEKGLLSAWGFAKSKLAERLQQGL